MVRLYNYLGIIIYQNFSFPIKNNTRKKNITSHYIKSNHSSNRIHNVDIKCSEIICFTNNGE